MNGKARLRTELLERRQAIPADVRRRHDEVITGLVRRSRFFREARTVALYVPVRSEVDLMTLVGVDGKTFVFPRVTGTDLVFSPADPTSDLAPGTYGIPEPTSSVCVDMGEVDLVLVPGIAFDRYGHRLGYGKGFYDRLIRCNPGVVFMGVCLEEFLLDSLPVDPWDARVAYVVTQAGIYNGGKV